MVPVEWLPTRPLTSTDAIEYERRSAEIERLVPLLGLQPDPDETVVLCFVRIREFVLWAGYHPGHECWVAIDRGLGSGDVEEVGVVLESAKRFVSRHYPAEGVAAVRAPAVAP